MPKFYQLKKDIDGLERLMLVGRLKKSGVPPVDPGPPVSGNAAKIARSLYYDIPAGYPRFETTGVPDNVTLTLATPTLDSDGYWRFNQDTTLNGLEIRAKIKANNCTVTIKNCKVVTPGSIKITTSGTGAIVMEDSELDGDSGNGPIGIGYNNITMRRCYVHHCVDGIRPTNNCLIEDCLVVDSVDNEAANHVDCLQMTGGLNVKVRHCSMLSFRATGAWGNAAIGLGCETNRLKDVLVENNYLAGGNNTMFIKNATRYKDGGQEKTTGVDDPGAAGVWYDMENVVVRNNEFRGDQRFKTTAGKPTTFADVMVRWPMRSTVDLVSSEGSRNVVFSGNFPTPLENRHRVQDGNVGGEGVWRNGKMLFLFQKDSVSGEFNEERAPDQVGLQVDPIGTL